MNSNIQVGKDYSKIAFDLNPGRYFLFNFICKIIPNMMFFLFFFFIYRIYLPTAYILTAPYSFIVTVGVDRLKVNSL